MGGEGRGRVGAPFEAIQIVLAFYIHFWDLFLDEMEIF